MGTTQTKDYAKLGQTTYNWSVSRWDEARADNLFLDSGETSNIEDAKKASAASLEAVNGDQVQIMRGTYEDESFDDDEYGHVLNADWRQDEHWSCYGFPASKTEMTWEEESW